MESKKQKLYLVLCGIFITNAVVAEIIGTKIFSVESTLGISPLQMPFFGNKYDINMSAGVLNWPVVFIISDILNEYFGQSGVKRISYLTALLILYSFFLLFVATMLVPAKFWMDVNSVDSMGNRLNINEAFNMIFRQGMQIIVGSLIAFMLGQLLDSAIFYKLRVLTKNKYLWIRATGSTLISQLIDSFVVIYLAFYLLAPADKRWTLENIMIVGSVNYIYKSIIAVCTTPVIYIVHQIIDWYLGKENADKMIKEAVKHNF